MPLIEQSGNAVGNNFPNIKKCRMVDNPRIAVVIPALNEEKLLPHTLASIDNALLQFTDPVIVVVVDNNSSDRTGQLARDSGAIVIFEENRRIASARQAGLNSLPTSVELVLTTDADTIVPPGWIGVYIHLLNQTEIAGAYGPVKYDFEESPSPGQELAFQLWIFTSEIIRRIKRQNNMSIGSGANSAYRIDAVRDIGGYNTSLDRAEDTDLFRRLQNVGKIEKTTATVTTSNRRIVYRGLASHFQRRLYANLYFLIHNKWPTFSTEPRKNIRF